MRVQINTAIRFIMVIAIPCAVGMGVLASPILQLVHFSDKTGLAAQIIRLGAISIVFFSLSTLSNGLLQGINRMKEPVKNAAIALVIDVIVLVVLMLAFDLGIYAVVISNASFGFVMCLLNAYSIRKYSGYRQEIKKTFLVPSLAAAGMGVAAWGVYTILMALIKINAIAAILSICVAVVVYAVLLLLLKGLNEKEIRRFPKGDLLVRLAKKMHLL